MSMCVFGILLALLAHKVNEVIYTEPPLVLSGGAGGRESSCRGLTSVPGQENLSIVGHFFCVLRLSEPISVSRENVIWAYFLP